MTAFQQQILADGDVSFAEYESAVLATVECIRSADVDVLGPFLESQQAEYGVSTYYGGGRDKSKFYNYLLTARSKEAIERAEQIDAECSAEYLAAVEFVYSRLNEPSEAEVGQFYRDLAQCLRDHGIDPADEQRPTLDSLAVQHAELGCG